MKTFKPLLVVMLLSFLAFAAATVRGSYTLSASPSAAPTLSTQGVALPAADSTKALKVSVAVASGEVISNPVSASAYCWKHDAGVWSRANYLDLTLASDAGLRGTEAITTLDLHGTLDCDRIYYATTGINASADAGTLSHTVRITQSQ